MTEAENRGKASAVVAYITIVGTIIAYFMNLEPKSKYAAFHIRQALGIHIVFYLLGILVGMFDSWFATVPFYIFIFTLLIYGIISAIQGSTKEVPLLGKFFQKMFNAKN